MAMKACVECKKEISTDSKTCPNCGKKNPTGKTPTWVVVLGVLVGLAILSSIFKESKDKGSDRSGPTVPSGAAASAGASAKAEPVETAMSVPLSTLLGEYKDNEVRSDGKFKDKLIKVSGKVDGVKKGLLDEMYVTVGTGAQFEIPQVQCMLAEDQVGKAASLSKGAVVTVQGRVDGLMMNVILRDCTIQ